MAVQYVIINLGPLFFPLSFWEGFHRCVLLGRETSTVALTVRRKITGKLWAGQVGFLSAAAPVLFGVASPFLQTSPPPTPAPRPVFSYVAANTQAAFPKLTCSVCLEPFFRPRKTPCRHTFCEACIHPVIAAGQPCPLCRAPTHFSQLTPADDTLQELLDELEVYCAHRAQGCPWKGPRGTFQEHVERTCEKLAEKERLKRELEKACRAINPPAAEMVKLSVGGRLFETSYATLCAREPNSVLAALFGNPSKLQRNSNTCEVHLDLDPDVFELVLAWLRAGILPSNLNPERTERLHTLATALRLESLANLARTPPSRNEKQPVLAPEVTTTRLTTAAELRKRTTAARTSLPPDQQGAFTKIWPTVYDALRRAADRGHTSAVIDIGIGRGASCLVSCEGAGNHFTANETSAFCDIVGYLEEIHGFKVTCSRESDVPPKVRMTFCW